MKIRNGTLVTAAYSFRDEHGLVINSSESNGPPTYVHGEGQILRGLESALEGRPVGDRLHLILAPEDAFGPHRPELVFEAPRANLPPDVSIEAGVELFSGMGDRPAFRLRVIRATENGVLLDGNHPLAGKTLDVDIEILEVREPPC